VDVGLHLIVEGVDALLPHLVVGVHEGSGYLYHILVVLFGEDAIDLDQVPLSEDEDISHQYFRLLDGDILSTSDHILALLECFVFVVNETRVSNHLEKVLLLGNSFTINRYDCRNQSDQILKGLPLIGVLPGD
jgi:hypothetical protein